MLTISEYEKAMNEGRLALHYQPRVSAQTKRIVGTDSILRLQDAGGAWAAAGSLDRLSIEQLRALWSWKLERIGEAFDFMTRYNWSPDKEHPSFSISMTLAAEQLDTDEWAIQLLQLMEHVGVPGRSVIVELVDESDSPISPLAEWTFEAIRNAGVLLELADFPVGEASMKWLSNYSFDRVKIDHGMLSKELSVAGWFRKREMLRGLITWIHGIGADVVLTGIDKELHTQFLSDLPVLELRGEHVGATVEFEPLMRLVPELLPTQAHDT